MTIQKKPVNHGLVLIVLVVQGCHIELNLKVSCLPSRTIKVLVVKVVLHKRRSIGRVIAYVSPLFLAVDLVLELTSLQKLAHHEVVGVDA